MRRIAVILGSKSDLAQCCAGLELLESACQRRQVELFGNIMLSSIHRATDNTLDCLKFLGEATQPPDVLIAGAGWANHLTGMCDSYLRYQMRNDKIVVVGVAFEDLENDFHTLAAKLSITEVPGNQVVFDDTKKNFVGSDGFTRACEFAINGLLPTITLPSPRPSEALSLQDAISEAHHQRGGT